MGKERDLQTRAEQEADKIGAQFTNSTDVIGDMSRAYHVDFSGIQIHSDEAAEQKVRAVGKDGLAQGNHLFFGRGILKSNAPEDKFLVGHELAHTMQQGVTGSGMGVSEHVPMGVAQYSDKNPNGEFVLDPTIVLEEERQEERDLQAVRKNKNMQVHHFISNKNQKYTPYLSEFPEKYGLDLDGEWNKKRMQHRGSHPETYHEWIYDELLYIDSMAEKESTEEAKRKKFLEKFEENIVDVVCENPKMLDKDGWSEDDLY